MSYREPMFLITDDGGAALGAVAVEDDRWVGRDTAGRTLFDRTNLAGAAVAARPIGRLVSTAWYGIRRTRPGAARSDLVRDDQRGLPYITDPHLGPMYVTPCCAATITITIDDGALCCRACYHTVDHRLAWDPDLTDPTGGDPPANIIGTDPTPHGPVT